MCCEVKISQREILLSLCIQEIRHVGKNDKMCIWTVQKNSLLLHYFVGLCLSSKELCHFYPEVYNPTDS